jgi:hypothetical protein
VSATFNLTTTLSSPLRSSGDLYPSILFMSPLSVQSQTISINGAREFSYNPDHTVYFFQEVLEAMVERAG